MRLKYCLALPFAVVCDALTLCSRRKGFTCQLLDAQRQQNDLRSVRDHSRYVSDMQQRRKAMVTEG